jgi:hypothetical protein
MNPIDLRTDLESVEAQLKQATTPDEIRRLNAKAERKQQPTSGYVEAWPYPLGTLKALEKRGLVTRASPVTFADGGIAPEMGGFVALTDAGRAAIEPPVKELDDLVVLDSETAAWPLDPRYYDVEPSA